MDPTLRSLYMSPEQLMGARELDARSDLFSLGVTMYEALAGVTPSDEVTNIARLVVEICGGKGVPLERRAPQVPAAVRAIVAKATALAPADRYQSAGEMQAAILALFAGGSSLTEEMLAPRVDPRALADTHQERTAVLAHDATVAIAMPAPAPSFAATAPLRVPPPSDPAPALAETSSAFEGRAGRTRSTNVLSWMGGVALVVVAFVTGIRGLAHTARTSSGTSAKTADVTSAAVDPSRAASTAAVAVPSSAVTAAPEVGVPALVVAPTAASSSSTSRTSRPKPKPKPVVQSARCTPPYTEAAGVRTYKEDCVE